MKIYFPVIALLFLSITSYSQGAADSVKNVVNTLFIAMKTSNSHLLKSCFTDSAILQTISKNKAGDVKIKNEKISEFAEFVGKQDKDIMDEQVIFDVVKTDADLAIAWTPYKFYYKGTFSHCGVNSFQFVRINNIWKIQYLIDTRRAIGCE